MSTGTVMPTPYQTILDTNGDPVSGGLVWTTVSGISTPQATYTTAGLSIANTNPIVADSAGRFVAFLPPGASYDFRYELAATPPSHGALIRTVPNVSTVPAAAGNVDVPGVAGQTMTGVKVVMLSAGQWFLAYGSQQITELAQIGMTTADVAITATGSVRMAGQVTGLSGITVGTSYYAGEAGALTSTPPTYPRLIGVGDSTTSIVLDLRGLQTENVITLTDGATPALDAALATIGMTGIFRLAAAGNRTIAIPTNPRAGQKIIIQHSASGGARTLALNTGALGFRFGEDITALTATTSGKTDYIGCVWNSTDGRWDVVAVSKGY